MSTTRTIIIWRYACFQYWFDIRLHDTNILADFRSEEIGRLVTWFEPVLKKGRCNIETVPRQWMSLKMMVKTQFQDMSDYSRLWSTMLTKEPYKTDYQDVLHLVESLLVLPILSAHCKHAFSTQNCIKSAKCSCLERETNRGSDPHMCSGSSCDSL